ncbi:hypothetical protein GUITHDRAFT_152029 [Guillardia theta CCMP2712]|uniref:Uncharacterized protein n=1 Tax=Guillardia theta (strain CCMP2712) TaxID=905079 RepID=L1JGW8_GUITC|nr:hypothetical protein GUITHDRAFT_152029 [Guillardia theta CCMP2712]EKX47577.1 hypothetical protein GUITHDRAFT_152029 [Guillardia theta CCMP2712]|eukprot:XP_005834557.1 hypothetical protein GUITHDRAFT_152029 [Guillardia theta CCMP2712]
MGTGEGYARGVGYSWEELLALEGEPSEEPSGTEEGSEEGDEGGAEGWLGCLEGLDAVAMAQGGEEEEKLGVGRGEGEEGGWASFLWEEEEP